MNHWRPLVLLCLLLAACGGGDPEPAEAETPRPGVDCKARPELCI